MNDNDFSRLNETQRATIKRALSFPTLDDFFADVAASVAAAHAASTAASDDAAQATAAPAKDDETETLNAARPLQFGNASIFGWDRDDSASARVNVALKDVARFGCFRAYGDNRSWAVIETTSGACYAVARSDQKRSIAKALKKLCGSLSAPRGSATYKLEWLDGRLPVKA